jgi:hypothetical protein
MGDGPWASMFEEPLKNGRIQTAAARLARMLSDFKIRPRTIQDRQSDAKRISPERF